MSRRDFLRLAGTAGVTVGLGAGLGGLLAACGTETSASTGSTAGTAATSVGAGAETGDLIKIGFITPQTGGLASFGIPDKYNIGLWKEAIGDGLVAKDGKKHPVNFEVQDSQSDVSRASQVAGDLINNNKIDLMLVASTPDTVTPVVEQCEANGVPCLSTDCPWQTYLGQNKEYKWSYHVFFGGEDYIVELWSCFDKVQSNKKIGAMFDNTADGNFYAEEFPLTLEGRADYSYTDPGRFQAGTEDFTAPITAFKRDGVELIVGNMIPPDFTNFWKQAAQQGLAVKAVMVGKALLFPQSVEALGPVGNGQLTELWWHPALPYKSSLTGQTCQELTDDFTAKTGQQWTMPLMHHAIGEMAHYALTNAANPKDKEAVLAAIEGMKFDTILGPIDFTAEIIPQNGSRIISWPGGPGRKTKNVYDHGLGASQWLMQGGKFAFDVVAVDKTCMPDLPDGTISEVKPLPIS